MIGVDSLGYLPKEKLSELVDSNEYCSSCFDGDYPTKVTNMPKNKYEQRISEGSEA